MSHRTAQDLVLQPGGDQNYKRVLHDLYELTKPGYLTKRSAPETLAETPGQQNRFDERRYSMIPGRSYWLSEILALISYYIGERPT